jgi:hypothetical protein
MTRLRALTRTCGLATALALIGLTAGPAPGDIGSEATRVRILLVVDTHGFAAKENGFAFDKDSMKRVIKEALRDQNLEDRYTLDILDGNDATPQKVLDYYRDLKLEPGEALLCYYSGHGGTGNGGTDNGGGHFLDLKAGRLSRDALRKAMEAKKARLMVLLTDCCANFDGPLSLDGGIGELPGGFPPPLPDDFGGITIETTFPDGPPFADPPPFLKDPPAKAKAKPVVVKVLRDSGRQNSLRNGRGEILKDLLFRQRGVIDITASTVGQLAFSSKTRGGYFTLTLTGLLSAHADRFEALGDGAVGWGSFFDALQSLTKDNANRESYKQIPQAFSIKISGGRR